MSPRKDVAIVDQHERYSWGRLIYSDGLIAWYLWIPTAGGVRRPFASVCIEAVALSEPETRSAIAATLRLYRNAQRKQRHAVDAVGLAIRRAPGLIASDMTDLAAEYPNPVVSPERRISAQADWKRRE